MQKTILILLFLCASFSAFSQDTVAQKKWGYKGYSGGMFVHLGYVESKHFTVFECPQKIIEKQLKGITFGFGGKMSIYLNTYFRVGGEGYVSTCNNRKDRNSCRMSWGGVAFDVLYPVKKWAPFAGITVGGGSATHLVGDKPQNNYAANTMIFTQPLCIINPAVGVEFFATQRISLLFKIDYILNIYKTYPAYPQGVRFYLGIHFYQKK
jgi:hypothetical protein